MPRPLQSIGRVLRLDQTWDMFAPKFGVGTRSVGWHVASGTLKSGAQVDILNGGRTLAWERPERIADLYRNQHWRKHLNRLRRPEYKKYLRPFAEYLCREGAGAGSDAGALQKVELYYMSQGTRADKPVGNPRRTLLIRRDCAASGPETSD